MSDFWVDQRVMVTGGRGFLGDAVCRELQAAGAAQVVALSSRDGDLRDPAEVARLFEEHSPTLVVHLAARVGGIGANQKRPADLYLDNLLMGTYVLEQARRSATPKTVMVGTICSYPKFTAVPFVEDALWTGYPEETNAPYGIAKLAQLVQLRANREQYGQKAVYLMPTNLYSPGDKFHPESRTSSLRSSRRRSTPRNRGPTTSRCGGPGRPVASSSTWTTRPGASWPLRSATTRPIR
jgi:GDP-L-fucose synthase